MPKGKTKRPGSRRGGQKSGAANRGTVFCWTHTGFAPLATHVLDVDATEAEPIRGRSLGLRLRGTPAVIDRLKSGLTIRSFERLSAAMEIPTAQLAEITGIAVRTLARRKKEGKLRLAESERVFRLATVFDKAIDVLGDASHARRWFKTPLKALAGKSPLKYSDTEIGAREVEDLLGRLEYGVFS